MRERVFRADQLAIHPRLADADEHAGHVGQRREVARGADRALGRNPRIHVVVYQRAQCVYQLESHARETFRERDHFHEHDQAHDVVVEILADAYRVRTHQVLLQLHEFVVADVHAGELPETGVDSVDLGTALHDIIDVFAGLRDCATRFDPERDFDGTTPCPAELCQRDELLVDDELHGTSSRPTIGRFRPCSFAHSIASG